MENIKWCFGLLIRLLTFIGLAYVITSTFEFILREMK
jgi:hypothetical protein